MGAELWFYEAPWDPDPQQALQKLQADFLAENYDLATLLPQHLEWAKESVQAARADGDPYGLVEIYEERLELMERLSSRPIPENPTEKIEILRQVFSDTGQGIGNILDVTHVSDSRDYPSAERLDEQELLRLAGVAKPSRSEAQKTGYEIHEGLHRGECVCFPFYEDGKPAGWYFVGNTID